MASVSTIPGTPWYRNGTFKNGDSIGPVGNGEFTSQFCCICKDTISCKTEAQPPCCPPSIDCVRDLVIGNCEHFGRNANILDGSEEGSSCMCYGWLTVCSSCYSPGCGVNCCMACYTSNYRKLLRQRFDIQPTCCCVPVPELVQDAADYYTHCFCHSCAHCQETNEMFVRGLRALPNVPDHESRDGEGSPGNGESETNPMLIDKRDE